MEEWPDQVLFFFNISHSGFEQVRAEVERQKSFALAQVRDDDGLNQQYGGGSRGTWSILEVIAHKCQVRGVCQEASTPDGGCVVQ